jgi:hypothetical protein
MSKACTKNRVGILYKVIAINTCMSFYNPENSWPATDDEILTLYSGLRTWLIREGTYKIEDSNDPGRSILGFELLEEGGVLVPEPIAITRCPPTYSISLREWGSDLDGLAPDQKKLLGINDNLMFLYREHYFKPGADREGNTYITADCGIAIFNPELPGVSSRTYALDCGTDGVVRSYRIDKGSDGAPQKQDDSDSYPNITSHECEALRVIGLVCATLFISPRKLAARPRQDT